MSETIEQKCLSKGVKLTDQRKVIAQVISESKEAYGESDHPDVDELYNRVSKIDPKISIATVYRTVKIFEEAGILAKHDFKGGKARYEAMIESHHDHLIDVKTGEIIEFVDDEIEKLQQKVYAKKGLNPDGSKIPPAPTAVAGAVDDAAAAVAKPGAIRRGANAVGRSVGKFGTNAVGATVTPVVGRVAGAPEAIRDADRGEAEVDSKGNFTGKTTGPNILGARGTSWSGPDADENYDFYDRTGMLMTKDGAVLNPRDHPKLIDPRTGKPFDSPETRKKQQDYQRQQRKDQLGK